MKRVIIFCILVWAIILVWAWWARASPYLACDLPEAGITITSSEVEITKVKDGSVSVVEGLVEMQGGNFLLLDLAGLAAESYRFRARWSDATGLPSEWSLFLNAGKPAPAVGLRVVP